MTLDHAHNIDVERAILAVLMDGRGKDAMATLLEICPDPQAFFNREHQLIARAAYGMALAGSPVNGQTIMMAMSMVTVDDLKGGKYRGQPIELKASAFAYVGQGVFTEISLAGGGSSGLRGNCEVLAALYRQRQTIAILTDALDSAKAVGASAKLEALGDSLINSMSTVLGGSAQSASMAESIGEALTQHDHAQAHGPAPCGTWGIAGLDRILHLQGGRLIVTAGASGQGKTSLALQAAEKTAEALGAGSVAFLSLEMRADELGRIMVARSLGVSTSTLERGWLRADQRLAADEIRRQWEGHAVALKATSGRCTAEDACGWIRQRHRRSGGKLALVVIDYLGLLDPIDPKTSEYATLTASTRMLKRLATDLRVCVLLLCQLNREGRKGIRNKSGEVESQPEPRSEDLRGSGSIEQDADGIVFIWPQQVIEGPSQPVALKVGKNRHGPTGSILAVFERARGQVFREQVQATRQHHDRVPTDREDAFADMEPASPVTP